MQYALDYGIVKETRVVPFGINSDDRKPFVLKGEVEQAEFLRGLGSVDQLFLEAGSGADYFCIGALEQGVSVFRLPTHLSKQFRAEAGVEKRDTASTIASAAQMHPEAFFVTRSVDLPYERLRILVREYIFYQRQIKGVVERRVLAATRGQYLMDRVRNLFRTVLRSARRENPVIAATEAEEKKRHDEVVETVKQLPLYNQVFARIPRFPVVAAAILIAEMGDPARFHSIAHLRRRAGFAVFDGESSVSRRQKGQRLDYDPELQTALWYAMKFGVQMSSPGANVWRDLYDLRKTYEIEKAREVTRHPRYTSLRRYDAQHLDRMALRYVGEKLLRAIWRSWRAWERGETLPEVVEPTFAAEWITPELRDHTAERLNEMAAKKAERKARSGRNNLEDEVEEKVEDER